MNPPPSQELFETCYRGRQSSLHHMSYMRMGKVLPALQILKKNRIELQNRRILDYGFGAGTFFRYLPFSAELYGVEQDPVTVEEVQQMLQNRGHRHVNMQVIDVDSWQDHPLLQQTYDLVICSHVLEHLPDPVAFLKVLRKTLAPGGCFLGLVPINELEDNAHHFWKVDRDMVSGWVANANLSLRDYEERDPWSYRVQPFYANESTNRLLTQGLGLGMGIPATLLGGQIWEGIGAALSKLLNWQNTQAVFIAVKSGS